ncbi:hypothetical protein [Mesonia sp. HuA40]|uniref:hypothetical protein n=1 Tax=Mesonia sp. HuA40 TaxID=2602761 RepID=UPI0011C96BB9|nr:hypothetical protein [Mesonia sp. HuA40]TXK72528.1 hypothetical protein FT993_06750 [Mesonia sp. HuA40]
MPKITFFLFFTFVLNCKSQSFNEVNLNLNPTIEYNDKSKDEFKDLISVLKRFFKTKNNSYSENQYWLPHDNQFYNYPFFELYKIENYGHSLLSPNLLTLNKITNERYIAKIGWFDNSNGQSSLIYIYNILIVKYQNEFKLKNILSYNLRNWKNEKFDKITYWTPKNIEVNKKQAEIYNNINKKIGVFFELQPISFTYFLCESNFDLMKLIGYDFEESMFFSNQNGALTYPHDRLIFSGNNQEINIHELVHLYVYEKFTEIHPYMNEGLATLFGGSKGFTYENHLSKLKQHLKSNKVDLFKEFFKDNYVLDYDTSLQYTLSAFLCDLAYKKGGKKSLFKLMKSGKSIKKLQNTIEEVLMIDIQQFDSYIRNELESYDFEQKSQGFNY